jgi:DNA-binding NtrC family response regulator
MNTKKDSNRKTNEPAGKENYHILIAEDDDEMRALLSQTLSAKGYMVSECSNGFQLINELKFFEKPREDEKYNLIISDIRMPGLIGTEVLEAASLSPDSPPIILITAFGDSETHDQARRFGAVAILDKPFDMDDLIKVVENVLYGKGNDGNNK